MHRLDSMYSSAHWNIYKELMDYPTPPHWGCRMHLATLSAFSFSPLSLKFEGILICMHFKFYEQALSSSSEPIEYSMMDSLTIKFQSWWFMDWIFLWSFEIFYIAGKFWCKNRVWHDPKLQNSAGRVYKVEDRQGNEIIL